MLQGCSISLAGFEWFHFSTPLSFLYLVSPRMFVWIIKEIWIYLGRHHRACMHGFLVGQLTTRVFFVWQISQSHGRTPKSATTVQNPTPPHGRMQKCYQDTGQLNTLLNWTHCSIEHTTQLNTLLNWTHCSIEHTAQLNTLLNWTHCSIEHTAKSISIEHCKIDWLRRLKYCLIEHLM